MKKYIVAALTVFMLFEGVYMLSAATQPWSLGYVSLSVSSGTAAAINASTAPGVGYLMYCTSCSANGGAGTLCISTSSTKYNSFVLSTGTLCQ